MGRKISKRKQPFEYGVSAGPVTSACSVKTVSMTRLREW